MTNLGDFFDWAVAAVQRVYEYTLGDWGVSGPDPWSFGFFLYWGITVVPQLFVLPALILEWRSSLRLFGIDALRLRRKLIAIKARDSMRRRIQSHFAMPLGIAIVATSIWCVTGADYLWSIITLSVLRCLCSPFLLPIPPAVLFLASSGKHHTKTSMFLRGAIWPTRVSTLLDQSSTPFIQSAFSTDDFRFPEHLWRESVTDLIAIAKVVVVDVRITTRALRWEIAELKKRDYLSKTLFLIKKRDEVFLLDLLASGSVRLLPERELIETVRRMTRSRDSLPGKGSNPEVKYDGEPRGWALAGSERWDYGRLLRFARIHLKRESKGKRGFLAEAVSRARLVALEKSIEAIVQAKVGRDGSDRQQALQDVAEDLGRIVDWDSENTGDTIDDPQAKEAARFLIAFLDELPLPFGRGRCS